MGVACLAKIRSSGSLMLKLEGKLTNREITSVQGVSTRRVQQLYNKYKSTGVIHVQKKVGRHKQPLPEQVKC